MLTGYAQLKPTYIAPGVPLAFDIYMWLPKTKQLVLYKRKGQIIGEKRLRILIEKDSEQLYVSEKNLPALQHPKKTDHGAIAKSFNEGIARLQERPPQNIEGLKGITAQYMSTLFMAKSMVEFRQMREVGNGISQKILMDLATNDLKGVLELVRDLTRKNESLQDHLFNVSTFSIMFGTSALDCDEDQVLFLGLGGLNSGIGLEQINPKVAKKYLNGDFLYETDERILTEFVSRSVRILKSHVDSTPVQILDTIYRHQENFDGSGFPKKLRGNQISPLAAIVRLAVDFNIAVSRKVVGNSPVAALKKMNFSEKYAKQKKYNPTYLSKIMKFLQVGTDEGKKGS